jgi:hypothetical protein
MKVMMTSFRARRMPDASLKGVGQRVMVKLKSQMALMKLMSFSNPSQKKRSYSSPRVLRSSWRVMVLSMFQEVATPRELLPLNVCPISFLL